MKDLIKKYWFLGIVALVLVVFVGYYTTDTITNKPTTVSSKQNDGKYALFSVNDKYYYADDLFENLSNSNGLTAEYTALSKAVAEEAIETTNEISTTASTYATYYLSYYGEETMDAYMKEYGYSGVADTTQYFINALKQNQLLLDFYSENVDKYVTPLIEENSPKIIYHILVKVADVTETADDNGQTIHVANPTEEESNKLAAALEGLSVENFKAKAAEFSDDSSSQNGGLIGLVDATNANNFVPEFAAACLELQPGQISDVITTTYGYHVIYCEEATQDTLLADETFLTELNEKYPNASVWATYKKANELGFKIYDENLISEIESVLESEGE